MAQQHHRKPVKRVTRQTELQPVYDAIDALQPDHVKAVWNGIDFRTRWMIVIGIAVLVTLWAVFSLTRLVLTEIRMTSGTFLTDELVAPYDLKARLIPVMTELTNLPVGVGDYVLKQTVYQVMPAPAGAETSGDAARPQPVFAVESPLARCLLNAAETPSAPCPSVPAAMAFASDYRSAAGALLNVAAAQFATPEDATEAMRVLRNQADSLGGVGNYVIGVMEVDYFQSSQAGLYHFTWSHGQWVYTVASASAADVEKWITQFPY